MALNAPWLKLPHVVQLFEVLGESNLRFVGGCVRDTLLGKGVHELDAATTHRPEQTMQLLQAANIKVLPTGIDHGTVTAVFGKDTVEITTLRSDEACDGRHANVTYTDDWREDAARRDFTINAIYADATATLYDYFGGEADLKNKQLKFIGDAAARIEEDYLRILRYFRFSAQLDFVIDAADPALTAIKTHMQGMQNLSGERIQQEMLKLLKTPNLSTSLLGLMKDTGTLATVTLPTTVPALDALKQAEGMLTLAPNPIRRLALWGKADLQTGWKLSNAAAEELQLLISTVILPEEKAAKRMLRQHGKETFLDMVALNFARSAFNEDTVKNLGTLANSWTIPTFPLVGKDLLAQGFTEGKALGDALKKLECVWEDSDYALDKTALLKQLWN